MSKSSSVKLKPTQVKFILTVRAVSLCLRDDKVLLLFFALCGCDDLLAALIHRLPLQTCSRKLLQVYPKHCDFWLSLVDE